MITELARLGRVSGRKGARGMKVQEVVALMLAGFALGVLIGFIILYSQELPW